MFGFAIWDSKRMSVGRFMTPEPKLWVVQIEPLFFTWRSILSKEHITKIEAKLEEHMKIRNEERRDQARIRLLAR